MSQSPPFSPRALVHFPTGFAPQLRACCHLLGIRRKWTPRHPSTQGRPEETWRKGSIGIQLPLRYDSHPWRQPGPLPLASNLSEKNKIPLHFVFLFKSRIRYYSALSESESHSVVFNPLQLQGLYSPWNSPGQNTGVGSRSLLRGIFPIQELNQGLPHCRRIVYQLSHKGSPRTLE